MSASPLFRQILSSQPVPAPTSAAPPELPDVLNMSDVHVISPTPNANESSRKAQRKAQLLQAFQRLLAKDGRKKGNAASAGPSPAAGGFTAPAQRSQTQPVGQRDMLAPPPPPTPSGPRIGVVKASDLAGMSGRVRTPQACELCRERKTKCSGTRPTCKRCFHLGTECVYVLDHKANRAQLRKLREASGLLPKSLRPAQKERRAQRKISPSRLDQIFKLLKSPSQGWSNNSASPVQAPVAAPNPSTSSFEFLNVSPQKTRIGSSPLASMSWTAPDAYSAVPTQTQPNASAMDTSYSMMNMDSDVDAAVAYMMANETLPEAQNHQYQSQGTWDAGLDLNMLAPPMMPTLSASSQASSTYSQSGVDYTPLPTPTDEDIFMTDMFGPDASLPTVATNVNPDEDLPASDSALERELESCMAEIFGATDEEGVVKFHPDYYRDIKPLPVRPRRAAPLVAPPVPPCIMPVSDHSFPLETVNNVYFDESLYDAFRIGVPKTAEAPRIVEITEEATQAQQENFDDIFNFTGEDTNAFIAPPSTGSKLQTIMEEPAEMNADQAAYDANMAALWHELFGDGSLQNATF
ncbi:hypothetical protein IEO21_03185 [Rhodonia placenta]|uniref:Zn(2)-C6 fungal-type domain-containing protein n=1 Tax=Rhodonia placenta TaxID=104341 RepID=A0A8H7P6B4_9APHY|nr:hypothetical protein IEO21_03185 [Postia placenta]